MRSLWRESTSLAAEICRAVGATGEDDRLTSIGRSRERWRREVGGIEKSILVHNEETEDAISAQRRQIRRRIVGLE